MKSQPRTDLGPQNVVEEMPSQGNLGWWNIDNSGPYSYYIIYIYIISVFFLIFPQWFSSCASHNFPNEKNMAQWCHKNKAQRCHRWLCGPPNAWWVCWPYGVAMTCPIAWDLPLPLEVRSVLGVGWVGWVGIHNWISFKQKLDDDEWLMTKSVNCWTCSLVFDIFFLHFNYCHPSKEKITIDSPWACCFEPLTKRRPTITICWDAIVRACDECPRIWVGFKHFIGNRRLITPIGSMYDIFTYIWLIFMVNVAKYTIHGSKLWDMMFFVFGQPISTYTPSPPPWTSPGRGLLLGSRGETPVQGFWGNVACWFTPPKSNIDTKNDGCLKCISFQIWLFLGYPC